MKAHARSQLTSRFSDPEYRHAFFSSTLSAYIASQIRANRKHRGWSQDKLASRAGMKQSRISTMEDVGYNRWTIKTLQRLAQAFDFTLSVRFESFGKALARYENFRQSLVEPSYSKDRLMHEDATHVGFASDTIRVSTVAETSVGPLLNEAWLTEGSTVLGSTQFQANLA